MEDVRKNKCKKKMTGIKKKDMGELMGEEVEMDDLIGGTDRSLVPRELVLEMTEPGGKRQRKKRRGGLRVSAQLVRTLASAGGTVAWEIVRKLAACRSPAVRTPSFSREIAPQIEQIRVRRYKRENEQLSMEWVEMNQRICQLERDLRYERKTREELSALHSMVLYQKNDKRNVKTQTYAIDFVYEAECLTKLLTEVRHVKDLYMKQKLLTASICDKYVKMRERKETIGRKLRRLEDYYRSALQETMVEFDRERIAFALLQRDGRLQAKAHAELAERCSTLSFNNAALQMALLDSRQEKSRPNDLAGDISMFSILKDTNNLARYERKMKKLENRRIRTMKEILSIKTGSPEKFIGLPIIVEQKSGHVEELPLFEIETEEDSRSEREEEECSEEKDEEGEEMECSLYSKSAESHWQKVSSRTSVSDLGYYSGGSAGRWIKSSTLINRADKKRMLSSKSAQEVIKAGGNSTPDIIPAVPSGIRIT